MSKKISFKQIALNNDQMFGLSTEGDVFEYCYDKIAKRPFWIKLPSEYEDGSPTVTTAVDTSENDIQLGARNGTFWEVYENEQKRKQGK